MLPTGPVILTAEEEEECHYFIKTITSSGEGKVLYAKKEHEEAVTKCLRAIALLARAERLLTAAGPESGAEIKDQACAAAAKAWAIYPLPIHLYDYACIMVQAGQDAEAKVIFKEFLKQQETFSPSLNDIGFLSGRDLPAAILHTKKILLGA